MGGRWSVMRQWWRFVLSAALAVALLARPAEALINPKLQPRMLFEMSKNVLLCRVSEVDGNSLTITLSVRQEAKGDFAPRKLALKAAQKELLQAVLSVQAGQDIVAFAGKDRKTDARRDVLYYVGGGKWFRARLSGDDTPDRWDLLADADEGKEATSADIMYGVFNGSVQNLWAMMQDAAAGRAYFPARPFERFIARKIDKMDRPLRGVALFDVNADGRLDVLVCGDGGVRLYIQKDKDAFEDRTAAFGLDGIAAKSCSLADADGDGTADLLLDGVLYLQKVGKFVRTDLVPGQASVKSAALVEIDGDGRPDVVVSRAGAGLAVYRNTFGDEPAGRQFADLTAKLGLDRPQNGAGGDGYFEPGDWNGDGRTDLLYLSGAGYLLLAGDKGFQATRLGKEGEECRFGAAAMAPIVHPDRNAAFIALAESKMLLEADKDGPTDVTRFGNEIQDDVSGMLSAVAEDLNADGTIDIYAAGSTRGSTGFYCMNRGYGSFMLCEKYNSGKVIPPEVYNQPAWGLAAGDVNGDGANDLAVTGLDGTLWLLVNQTLADRKDKPDLSAPLDQRKQIQTRLLTVRVEGRTGVVGCRVRLSDEQGRLVGARQLGGNVAVGCCGPHQATLAAREPGAHKLAVLFADGAKLEMPVSLQADQPRHQTIVVSRQKAR